MTAPLPFPLVTNECVEARPDWWRQPGETMLAFRERMTADCLARQERDDAERERRRALGLLNQGEGAIATGIGTFDANGHPKGSGWC